ncbi:MAG TPA: histidine kinase [Ginsengibacter sp.]
MNIFPTRFFLLRLCLIGVFILGSFKAFNQQLSFKLYNINDGLPGTEVAKVFQDSYGYLWLASSTGVSRFDGRQFVNFTLSDGLPSFRTNNFFQDSHDRLWVGTNAGMAQFKNNKFISYPTTDQFKNLYVFDFAETRDKHLWACTDKGVYEFEGDYWKKIFLCPGFENKPCRNIVETNNELYVNYATDLMCKSTNGDWISIGTENEYGSIFNLLSIQGNEIMVGTHNNIFTINNHVLNPIYKGNIEPEGFFSYLIDSQKRLWIAGRHFLRISKPGEWNNIYDSLINKSDFFYAISKDNDNNIWVGSSQGLLKIRDVSFISIDSINKKPVDGIYNMIPLSDGGIIFSSGTNMGMQLYSRNAFNSIPPPIGSGNQNYYKDPVDAYTFDNKKSLWLVTRFLRFLHFNGRSLEDFSKALNLKTTENIYDLKYIKSRNQFFICADSTLLYGDSSKFSVFIPYNTGVPIVKPTRIIEINNNLLLLYIDGVGVYGIDSLNNFFSLIKATHIDGSNKGIQIGVTFYKEGENHFWIGFPGLGLYEYEVSANNLPYLINHLTVDDGLTASDYFSLASDRQNKLWVASNSGVDILQLNKDNKWEIFNYAKVADLSINEFNFEKLVTDSGGNVWLSSPRKIIKFLAGGIKLQKKVPGIIIERVSLNFKETNWNLIADSLYSYYQLPYNPVLKYYQNSLGIFFNATDLSTTNSFPEYSYKLIPLDTAWSISSKIKSVSFAQLPAGKYQFLVRAKDNASGWSAPALFSFTITPPFWDNWWFRLLVIAIVSLIIVTIFRARVMKIRNESLIKNQLKELELKALKAQMNPHFIYNALNSIQALFADDKKTEGIHYIGSFSRLLRQVLDNSENNVISLDKELETIRLYVQLEALRLDMQLQFTIIVAEDIVPEFEKIPPLILQPFVENALWHGLGHKEGEKEIKVIVSANDNWLVCDITDNGIGRLKAKEWKNTSGFLHQSKAMDITRRRLIDFNENDLVAPIEFIDLLNKEGAPAGTKVVVNIKRKFS